MKAPINKKILIVEDQFIEANNLQMILKRAGYVVTGIARSFEIALKLISRDRPDLVLLDIYLQEDLTGIDLAKELRKQNIAFVYLSANSNQEIFDQAKRTKPYGFLVKPFREKDVLVTLDIAWYLHEENLESLRRKEEGKAAPKPMAGNGGCKDIIGYSKGLKNALEHVMIVAESDISVLIMGESGTGKERLVDCIHSNSRRRSKPLIKVSCTTLPANLIESELFGHERGAFTGALDKRIGKFEQADGGTIFLDEIGDMPPELQVKLLRVLQEKEIDRLGGKGSIKIDVRVIAATNRNMEKEVAEGRFRLDLYYRLNVFPLVLPPLRERKEDIPLLAAHFTALFSDKFNRKIKGVSAAALNRLLNYSWPGNIRELEHVIERSVLLCREDELTEVHLPSNAQPIPSANADRMRTIFENERDHILAALQKCNGKIYGKGGAAELLEINVSTLNSRIKKLGIEKGSYLSVK